MKEEEKEEDVTKKSAPDGGVTVVDGAPCAGVSEVDDTASVSSVSAAWEGGVGG
jgi:hypothetical protein